MIARGPSTSGTQRRKKAHSPIIYRNCHTHVNTPRISVWDRMGQRNSVKRRLDWPHVRFDSNRLGTKVWPPTDPKEPRKNWSDWKASSVWKPWQSDKVPRCAEFNRRIWLPQQEREWNNSHTPGGTSNRHQNEDNEEDEIGGIESTEYTDQEEERN